MTTASQHSGSRLAAGRSGLGISAVPRSKTATQSGLSVALQKIINQLFWPKDGGIGNS